jgi:hypothetical protein
VLFTIYSLENDESLQIRDIACVKMHNLEIYSIVKFEKKSKCVTTSNLVKYTIENWKL